MKNQRFSITENDELLINGEGFFLGSHFSLGSTREFIDKMRSVIEWSDTYRTIDLTNPERHSHLSLASVSPEYIILSVELPNGARPASQLHVSTMRILLYIRDYHFSKKDDAENKRIIFDITRLMNMVTVKAGIVI